MNIQEIRNHTKGCADLEPLFIDTRGADWIGFNEYEIKMDAKRYETWEYSYVSLIGLKETIRYANKIGIGNIQNRNNELSSKLRKKLSEIPNVKILDKGSNLASIITFHRKDLKLDQIENLLSENNIFYSVSPKSDALIDFTKKGVDWAIRFSPHYFNTIEEIDSVVKIIEGFRTP